jgi:hypothetical protein
LVGLAIALESAWAADLAMPSTAGETLAGQRMVLADAVRGHKAVIVAGFSREGGNETGAWVKAIHADAAMAGVPVYTMAMLEGAPGFIRGMIKSGMKKGVAAADQGNFVVLTQDEKAWREYFGVAEDKDAYVVLLDGSGKMVWHGHGTAELEPALRAAVK